MSKRLNSGLDPDFDVVAEPVQAVHQLSFGQIGEVAAQHVRHLRLCDAHPTGRLVLGQAEFAHGLDDLDHEAGFDLEFVGTGQAEIRKNIPGANLDPYLDAINESFCHGVTVPKKLFISAYRIYPHLVDAIAHPTQAY